MWFWWKIGWFALVPSILIHIPFYGAGKDTIGIISVIVSVLLKKKYQH